MLAQFMQVRAFHSADPLAGMMAASRFWPIDHEFNQAMTEYVFAMPTHPPEALEALTLVLEHDPNSADTLTARMALDFVTGDAKQGLQDWKRLARIAPRSRVVQSIEKQVLDSNAKH